jgi:hypothetical protein
MKPLLEPVWRQSMRKPGENRKTGTFWISDGNPKCPVEIGQVEGINLCNAAPKHGGHQLSIERALLRR